VFATGTRGWELGSSLSPSPAPSTSSASNPYNLTSADFVKMMITQLQNQDPLQPESNDQLMSQMNQIGQLQSNSMMQDTLKGLGLQTQIGSASSLIGKMVEGAQLRRGQQAGGGSFTLLQPA